RLTRWIVAQVALAATFGLIFGIGLLLMGVPFAVSIAIIGAILEFVPFLGGFISLTLSTLVSLTFRPEMTIWVVVLYFAIQQLQLNVLQPVLFGHAVDVHPAIVLIGLLVGAQLGGVIGALFAIPIAVVIITVLDEIEKPGDMLPPPDDASQSPGRLPGRAANEYKQPTLATLSRARLCKATPGPPPCKLHLPLPLARGREPRAGGGSAGQATTIAVLVC